MQYVLMAIPAELVPAVAALVAECDAEERPFPSQAESAERPMINGWTESLVKRAYQESADPMRRVLLFLAKHGGREVTSEEIADAIDAERGWNTVAGMLGAFGRRSTNRYGRKHPMWDVRQGETGTLFKMPPAVADAIKAAVAT